MWWFLLFIKICFLIENKMDAIVKLTGLYSLKFSTLVFLA